MSPKLESALANKYPDIFRDIGCDEQSSLMAFGVCVGDGWYKVIDTLCGSIAESVNYINRLHPHLKFSVTAAQIKEKWGGLRFYVDFHYDPNLSSTDMKLVERAIENIGGKISLAEKLCDHVCCHCGSMNGYNKGFASSIVLCDSCREKLLNDLTSFKSDVN